MSRKILVAVDEGEESIHALSWCLKNVVSSGKITVIVLYVMPHRTVYAPMDGTGYLFSDEIVESIEKHGQEVAESVVKTAKSVYDEMKNVDVDLEIKIERGDARDVICDAVEKLGCYMLVIGSHGYGAFKRTFLGSVSDYCAHNANCPVLIVKKPKDQSL
ncbi:Universal stress protein A-like protein [Zostera marina]|uniref:Universal stress protein A-like protein n=1 Tax=Zostera marina TaxID=29655 RepID=A0A0K9PFX6_ZOSMR|nr:Universal stress protein A-like protein [Zostera marina]